MATFGHFTRPNTGAQWNGGKGMAALTLVFLGALGFTIMFENSVVIPGIGTLTRGFGILAALAAVGAVLAGHELRLPDTPVVLMAAFVGWAALTALWGTSPDLAAQRLGTMVQGFLLTILLWTFATSDEARRWMLTAWVGGSVVLAATLIRSNLADAHLIFDFGYRRLKVFDTDPNESAALLATAIPIVWYLASQLRRRWPASFVLLLIPAFVTGVLLTGSRGGSVAMIFALASLPLSLLKREAPPWHLVLALTVVGIVAVTAVAYLVPASTLARIADLPTELRGGTWTDRITIWRAGLETFSKSPLAGIGIGSYADMSLTKTGLYFVAHNTFISVLVEQGLIGLTLFALMLGAVGARILRSDPTIRWLLMAILATWAVGGITVSTETAKETWFLMGILVCVRPGDHPCPD